MMKINSLILTMMLITSMCFSGNIKSFTYSEHVFEIFQNNCVECHQPGEIAPMSLTSYEEVRPWAKSIKKEVLDRRMPPWHADSNPGIFENDISLSKKEINIISAWVDQGSKAGNLEELKPLNLKPQIEWKLGDPDLVISPSEPILVPVTDFNEDLYQCIVLPYTFEEDKWITGIEYKVDNRQIVHHIIGFTDRSGKSAELDSQTPEPGFLCSMGGNRSGIDSMLGGWAPGMPPNDFSEETGTLIKKGSQIVLQMHYFNQTDSPVLDASGIGLHFAEEPILKKARILPIAQWRLYIPAGDDNAEHRQTWRATKDITIYSIMPHMHYIGKDMKVNLTWPDGTSETILDVPRFDFNWQTVYSYIEPLKVPRGSKIEMIAHHDNSADNPSNPSNPPIDVTWGESTTEEMAIAWINYANTDEDLTKN